jgi:hypothetical protein
VVICLVGGGQEINTGEGGISEWLAALDRSFPKWRIYVSDRLVDSEYWTWVRLSIPCEPGIMWSSNRTCTWPRPCRSFRSENVIEAGQGTLDLEIECGPRDPAARSRSAYPIALTRDLDTREAGSVSRRGVQNGTASSCRRMLNALSRIRWTSRLLSIPCTGSSTVRTMSARRTISRTSATGVPCPGTGGGLGLCGVGCGLSLHA